MKEIFFDNASTTKVREEVINTIINSMNTYYANADSIHNMGLMVSKKIKEEKKVFNKLGLDPERIFFTAGGGDANNIVIQSIVRANRNSHVITSRIEHPSVLETFKNLENVEVDYVDVDEYGFIDEDHLLSLIKENTVLVSIAFVNSELGTIQDIERLSRKVKEKNKNIVFHTDFVQGLGHIDINFKNFLVDAISFSSHKIYGPKGIGAFYIAKNVKFKNTVFGSNTENLLVPRTMPNELVLGFLKAIELLSIKDIEKLKELKKYTISKLKSIEGIRVNTPENSSPAILNVSFENARGEIILNYLSGKGIYISTGSACSSKKAESSVINAINLDAKYRQGVIRISFSIYNTKEEIDKFIEELNIILNMIKTY